MRNPPELAVDEADAAVLRGWIDRGPADCAPARRARIVVLSAAGHGPTAVARLVGCSTQTVIAWRERYRSAGLAGLRDAPRSGRPAIVDPLTLVRHMLQEPRPGRARWSTRSLAAELGISNVAVANIWRAWGIVPAGGGRVRLSTEPALDAPASDAAGMAVTGMYVDGAVRLLALAQLAVPRHAPRCEPPAALGGIDRRFEVAAIDRRCARADPAALATFLRRLGDGPVSAMLVESPPEPVARWAETRRIPLHVVPDGLSWDRLARVACLAAATGAEGSASVSALRAAFTGPVGDVPIAWLLPAPARRELVDIGVAG